MYRGWQAVAAVEIEEQRAASIALRLKQRGRGDSIV